MAVELGDFCLDRMVSAVEKVRIRLLRATSALEKAGVPYAVVGGNAVAAWVTRVDEAAVRYTQDIDILVRREDLDAVRAALEPVGFAFRHTKSGDMFLDGRNAKARDAVHVVFAHEKVRPGEPTSNPDVTDSEMAGPYRVIGLFALVQIKLTAFRDKDRTHLRDMIDVGLIDQSWPARFDPVLGSRLQQLLDHPEG